MPHFEFTGAAVVTSLRSGIGSTDMTIPLQSGSGWPTGAGGKPFTATIGDPLSGLPEEKILCSARTDNDLTATQRGYDNTSPQEWGSNARIRHTISAVFAADATDHINVTSRDDHAQYHTDARHAAIAHTQGMLATDSVGQAQIQADAVGLAEIQANAVGTAELIDASVTLGKLDPTAVATLLPSGIIVPYGGVSAPFGWLLCDGSAVSRSGATAALFGVFGTTYGVGDGSTTFNLPDLRQRFPLGKAASGTGAALGSTGGLIDHVHPLDSATSHAKVTLAAGFGNNLEMLRKTVTSWTASIQGDVANAGGATPNETSAAALGGSSDIANPPFLALNYVVKT